MQLANWVFKENISKNKKVATTSIENKLGEINTKLSNVLTISDRAFIKNQIKYTVNEMNDNIVASLCTHLDILEDEVHTRSVEIEIIKKN